MNQPEQRSDVLKRLKKRASDIQREIERRKKPFNSWKPTGGLVRDLRMLRDAISEIEASRARQGENA